MTKSELQEIVEELRRTGRDNQYVEAKKATDFPRSTRNTLSAFSNRGGGVIVLGLDEAAGFASVGIDDAADMTAKAADACSDMMEPPVRAAIETHEFEGVLLVTVDVPEIRPDEKPL